jgi:hypothetical protein
LILPARQTDDLTDKKDSFVTAVHRSDTVASDRWGGVGDTASTGAAVVVCVIWLRMRDSIIKRPNFLDGKGRSNDGEERIMIASISEEPCGLVGVFMKDVIPNYPKSHSGFR